jgi:hypothetical protein
MWYAEYLRIRLMTANQSYGVAIIRLAVISSIDRQRGTGKAFLKLALLEQGVACDPYARPVASGWTTEPRRKSSTRSNQCKANAHMRAIENHQGARSTELTSFKEGEFHGLLSVEEHSKSATLVREQGLALEIP